MKVGPLRMISTEEIHREAMRRQSPGSVGDLAQPYRTRGALVALTPHEPCGVTGSGSVDMSAPGLPIVCSTRRTFRMVRDGKGHSFDPVDAPGCGGVSKINALGIREWTPREQRA